MKHDNSGEIPIAVILVILTVGIILFGAILGGQQGKRDLAKYQEEITEAKRRLSEAREKAERDRRPGYEKISADDETIDWRDGLSFVVTVKNDSSAPVKKLMYHAQITQYNPVFQVIASEDGWYDFREPLRVAESREIRISSNTPGVWGSEAITKALNQTRGFGYHVAVRGAEGIDGVRFKEKEGVDYSDVNRYVEWVEKYQAEVDKRK